MLRTPLLASTLVHVLLVHQGSVYKCLYTDSFIMLVQTVLIQSLFNLQLRQGFSESQRDLCAMKFAQTRNLLWQEGAYNKHMGILH